MKINSQSISFLISFICTALTVIILVMMEAIPLSKIITYGILTLVSTFIICYLVLELLIFRQILHLRSTLEELIGDNKSMISLNKYFKNPLRYIRYLLKSYHNEKDKQVKELERLAAFRKEFIADVSHELKTPIFAAQGFVHTLLDGAIKDKSVRNKFLKKAARSLDGLDILVQDLVTLSQLETGEIRMHFEYFDIYRLTEEVFEQFENKAVKKKIKLRFKDPEKKRVLVYADPHRIYQVLLNLISNAINYTDEKGEVLVDFEVKKNEVIVKVIDDGIGIPKQDIGRIFQRFYRVEKSRSRKQGGTGLGLAIVKHIVELHKSKIKVISEVGKGSEFIFRLPKGKPEPIFQSLVNEK